MPQISIIVPVYNVEQYLARCIDSLLVQTYRDFEVILVDDGSTDQSGMICDAYAAQDPRIRVIHKPNGGQSSARNAALKVMKGDYLCFCDSDDWVEPDFLSTCFARMERDGTDLVRFANDRYQDGFSPSGIDHSDAVFLFDSDRDKMRFLCRNILNYRLGWEVWAGFFRADIVRKYGICFPTVISYAEDMYFTVLYLYYAKSVSYMNCVLYHYFFRSNSTMSVVGKVAQTNDVNHLLAELYRKCPIEYIQKNYYQIYDLVFVGEAAKRGMPVEKAAIHEKREMLMSRIDERDFLSSQMKPAASMKGLVSRWHSDGFVQGYRFHTFGRYLYNGKYLPYRLSCIIHRILCYIKVRIFRLQ